MVYSNKHAFAARYKPFWVGITNNLVTVLTPNVPFPVYPFEYVGSLDQPSKPANVDQVAVSVNIKFYTVSGKITVIPDGLIIVFTIDMYI